MFKNIFKSLWFSWMYLRGKPAPWDSGVTPPELVQAVAELTPGRALDIGCGSGTNLLYLAQHGWQVAGVDFSSVAVSRARKKLESAGFDGQVLRGDASRLSDLPLHDTFDFAYDIGCAHSFGHDYQTMTRYSLQLRRLMRDGAVFMIYAHEPRVDQGDAIQHGFTRDFLVKILAPGFNLLRWERGKEGRGPHRSAWYWFEAAPDTID